MAICFQISNEDLMINSEGPQGQVHRFNEIINKIGTPVITSKVSKSMLEQVMQCQKPVLLGRCEKNLPFLEACACQDLHKVPQSELIQHILGCPTKVRVNIQAAKFVNQNQPQNPKNDNNMKIRSRL